MRDIDVVECDPEQAGRNLRHKLTCHEGGEFVGTLKISCVRHKIAYRKLQDVSRAMEFRFVHADLGSEQRSLVIVPQEVFVVEMGATRHGAREKLLGQQYLCSEVRPILAAVAAPDAVEAVARSNYPRVRRRSRR